MSRIFHNTLLTTALCASLIGCSEALSPTTASQDASDSLAAAEGVLPDSLNRQLEHLQSSLAAIEAQQDSIRSAIENMTAALERETGRGLDPRARTGEVLENAGEAIQYFGFRMVFALITVVIAWYFVKGTTFLLERRAETNAKRRLFYKRLIPIARIVTWTVVFIFVVRGIFQVDTQGFFAATAAIGVAIGFAAQDVLKNIFGGLVIIFDQSFQTGDKVSIGGAYGEVTSIGLRSTRIVTPDDNQVTVPNSQIVDSQVSNANAGALDCQVVTDLFLPGWVDESLAKEIAYQAAASSKYVYLKKPIVVLVKDVFDHTFLTRIRVKAYVLDIRYEFALMSDVTERARAEFRRQGLIQPTYGAWPRAYPPQQGDGRPDIDLSPGRDDDTQERNEP